MGFDRAKIAAWLSQKIEALEARDISALAASLHPEICFTWPPAQWHGSEQLVALGHQHLANCQAICFHLQHLLIDEVQGVAALAWVLRYASKNSGACRQILGGAILQFNNQGLLRHCRVYLDPLRSKIIPRLDVPWPATPWTPHPQPGSPPTRAQVEKLIHAHAKAWSTHNVDLLSQLVHDEIHICPPWDYQIGRENAVKGAKIYFNYYQDTQVTPRRIIFDSTQPHFGVCEQTFACTNPETGRRGYDRDFAFFEIAQGKLRYWRTYFDTTHSVQQIEKTAGFIIGRQDVSQ